MYDKKLARRILESLEEAFPRKLHLNELQAVLPEYKDLPSQEWLLALEALRMEGKLTGKFLPGKTQPVAAALLHITERGRLKLKELTEPIVAEFTDAAPDHQRAP